MPPAFRSSRYIIRSYTSWHTRLSPRRSPGLQRSCSKASRRYLSTERKSDEGEGIEGDNIENSAEKGFLVEFRRSYDTQTSMFRLSDNKIDISRIDQTVTAVGFLEKRIEIGKKLVFIQLKHPGSTKSPLQVICNDKSVGQYLRKVPIGSSISVTGILNKKQEPLDSKTEKSLDPVLTIDESSDVGAYESMLRSVEMRLESFSVINSFASDIHSPSDTNSLYGPENRHLQIRYNEGVRQDLSFRSSVARWIRERLDGDKFQEIETPVLFKSTSEGAREFLVPTRRKGYAYALPQSPQQYKQILMASGITSYYQFARCFRDEDLRADRQPEFTQVDLEVSWATGEYIMQTIESLIKHVYSKIGPRKADHEVILPGSAFPRISYDDAMSKHGSDKPDLRIAGQIHRIEDIIPSNLKSMLTTIEDPIVEICRFQLKTDAKAVSSFINNFMETSADHLKNKAEGSPGICVYNARAPLQGLQMFGHEGAEKLIELINETGSELDEGDLLILQARENKPHTGGSTTLGNLRRAIHKDAIMKGLIEPDLEHRYLWVTDFPMFTLNNSDDPGQGGASGFSATHHPFTAPKTMGDIDLLFTDPLQAKADHYDLVVNGMELGGGSRRIHSAEMQELIMRDILKMTPEGISGFSHLLNALRAGCPPHAGFAIGFDRLVAVMRGRESIRDVIAFPKNSRGEDLLVNSPAKITDKELRRYHLDFTTTRKPVEAPVPEQKVGEGEEKPSQA